MNAINRCIDKVTGSKPVHFIPDDDQLYVDTVEVSRRQSTPDGRRQSGPDLSAPAPPPMAVMGVEDEMMMKKKVEKYSFSTAFVFSFFTMLFCGFIFGALAMLFAGLCVL